MGNYTKTLLIGCGGSGIATLTRLNELLSSNPNFRSDVRENISYLLIDTDRGALDGFEATIEAQMGGRGRNLPAIAKAHITEGLSHLNDVVGKYFDKFEGETLEEMKKHWLYSPDGKPFRATHIGDVTAGAGQCCQVSYLATWNYMRKLNEKLETLWD